MYVITGATGNVSSKITGILLSQGQKVRVIGRNAKRLQKYTDQGAEAAAGNMEDTGFLTEAFAGASSVFAMIPTDYTTNDFRGYYNKIGASIAKSIEAASVTHVVNLSSQGAHLSSKTGVVLGLHDQEERLNALEGINVLHLRPTFFMENFLMDIDMIKQKNIMGSAIRGDLKFAMIATKDIAKVIAEYLLKRDFSGISIRDLLGQRDISMHECAEIIGRKISKPGLKYVQFPYEDAEKGMIVAGLSEDVSKMLVELHRAINEGLLAINLPRTPENTTATPFEEFAETFAEIYNA
jgi:uncharacterized protein YbjT (DUF2867 family)